MKIKRDAIKKIMIEKEMTIKNLAEKAEISYATASRVTTKTLDCNYRTIGKLARALDVDATRIIEA